MSVYGFDQGSSGLLTVSEVLELLNKVMGIPGKIWDGFSLNSKGVLLLEGVTSNQHPVLLASANLPQLSEAAFQPFKLVSRMLYLANGERLFEHGLFNQKLLDLPFPNILNLMQTCEPDKTGRIFPVNLFLDVRYDDLGRVVLVDSQQYGFYPGVFLSILSSLGRTAHEQTIRFLPSVVIHLDEPIR